MMIEELFDLRNSCILDFEFNQTINYPWLMKQSIYSYISHFENRENMDVHWGLC